MIVLMISSTKTIAIIINIIDNSIKDIFRIKDNAIASKEKNK